MIKEERRRVFIEPFLPREMAENTCTKSNPNTSNWPYEKEYKSLQAI